MFQDIARDLDCYSKGIDADQARRAIEVMRFRGIEVERGALPVAGHAPAHVGCVEQAPVGEEEEVQDETVDGGE